MQDTSKYLVHADITAEGVVERSDVVGAIFGQTEGLLGDDLDLRDLQESSKVGRIDVEIDSENGQSFGRVTIASGLDKVETAILAAALETIDRIGPCRAKLSVSDIEDVRTAKRREVVERATTLLTEEFGGAFATSDDIIEEVRQSVRVEDITDYEGLPAGPRVENSDAVVVVEGRADVLTLLRYGIKNAVAVEGTNVPDEVAELSEDRTVTAFLDGDRGGELVLKELAQVGDVDYVALAPPNRSVEDLDRHEVMAALRDKTPYETLDVEAGDGRDDEGQPGVATDGSVRPAPGSDAADAPTPPDAEQPSVPGATADAADHAIEDATDRPGEAGADDEEPVNATEDAESAAGGDGEPATGADATERTDEGEPETEPETLRGHVREVVAGETGTVRLLDASFDAIGEAPAAEAFDAVREADPVPAAVVLDGTLSQRILDVAAQRGVEQVVAAATGEFVKRPTGVRIRTAAELLQVPDE